MIVQEKDFIETLPANELPADWRPATIGGLIAKDGLFVDGDWIESKDQDPNGDVRLIQLADIGDGFYRNRSDRYLTYDKALSLGCTFLKKGDVLIARMPDPLGRACIFPGDSKKAVTAVDVCIVRPNREDVDNRWLMYFVNAPAFRAAVASLQSGSTRKRISRSNLAKIQLPVPPAHEQKRIVAEIEKQFSRLDEAAVGLKRIKANLKRYKAAVLKAAVEGKLTEEWRRQHPDVEPASELLRRILAERRKKFEERSSGKKYKEPTEPDTLTLSELPTRWAWATLEQLTSEMMNGFGKRSQVKGHPRIVLRLADVVAGEISLANVRQIHCLDEETAKYSLSPDDLMILRVNGSPDLVGRFIIVKNIRPKTLFCDHFIRVRTVEPLTATWLRIYSDSDRFRRFIDHNKVSSAGQNTISQGALAPFTIPLPPINELKQIKDMLSKVESDIHKLEESVSSALLRAESLRQTILSQAFKSNLI